MFAVREKHKWIVNSMLCQVNTREAMEWKTRGGEKDASPFCVKDVVSNGRNSHEENEAVRQNDGE